MKELKKYYHQIRSLLPCCHKKKKDIINRIDGSVQSYFSDHPDAGFPDVLTHFGTPQQIAASCVEEMDTQTLLKTLRLRKRVFLAIVAFLFAVLLVWAGAVTIAVFDAHNSIHHHYEVNITEQ